MEKLGLTFISSIDWDHEPWQFNETRVYRKGRTLYWASDSGCSCPIPFEYFTALADFETGKKSDLRRYLMSRASSGHRNTAELVSEINEILDLIK